MSTPDVTQSLLAESAWIRRLARSLVRDAGAADDLAQETLIEAVTRPPAHASTPRGWLASVLRRRIGHRRREEARRAARERRVARPEADGDTPSTDERMRRHADLVQHTQALDEPYRSAIVLRFFDDLAPREIAARLDVPVTTVNSRIQRGLERLRARLDAQPGGRDEWLAALTAIGWPRAGGLATSGPWIGVTLLMKSKLFLVAVLVLLVGIAWFATRGAERASSPSDRAPEQIVGDGRARRAASSSDVSAPSDPNARASIGSAVASAPSATSAASRRGRVVDARGRALAGVPVLHHDGRWPTWQSGDAGWINDGVDGVFVPPAEVEALRADPRAAEAFFARFPRTRDWRAVVLGEAPAERTATSDADGRFAFDGLGPNATFELASDAWILLAQVEGDDGATWLVAAPAVRVAGRVLDGGGRGAEASEGAKSAGSPGYGAPLVGARVTPRWVRELALAGPWRAEALTRVWTPGAMNTDAEGRYLLRAVPVGVVGLELRASAPGFEPRDVRPPTVSRDDFDVVLDGARGPRGLTLDGVVLDPDRRPVADAEVVFGRDRVTTDLAGRFAFAHVEPDDTAALTAIRAGFVPVQRAGLVPELRADPARGRGVELRLGARTRTLRGVVLDGRGAPLVGVNVNVFDPMLLDVTFTPLEGRLGGWERAAVTDAAGRFELGGLAPRAYRLRVWRADTSFVHVTEPIATDRGDVTIQVPSGAFFERVRGRVTREDGTVPQGLRVAVVYPIHVTRGGGGSMTESSVQVGVAADGAFELRDVPRAQAELVIGSTSDDSISIPVEAIESNGTITIAFRPTRVLRIVGATKGVSASVVDAERRPLAVEVLVAGARVTTTLLTATIVASTASAPGEFPPCVVPTNATAVVFQLADGTWASVPIEDDTAGLARARAPF